MESESKTLMQIMGIGLFRNNKRVKSTFHFGVFWEKDGDEARREFRVIELGE